jgi:hypothetical protein
MYIKIHSLISLVLKTSLLVGAVLCFFWGHYQLAFGTIIIISITLLPVLLKNHFQVDFPPEFECLAVLFIYAALYLGSIQEFYVKFWWWDILLHTSSGFILGIVGFLLVYVLNNNRLNSINLKPGFIALFAFMFSIGIGALWEIFEFIMDQLLDHKMQEDSLIDTMWDLIVDSIGALIISIMGWKYISVAGNDSFLEKWINSFIEKNPGLFISSIRKKS